MKSRWLVLALAGPLLAQPSTTFSVDVNLVRVPCIVTRANGAPVKNLRKEDFIVLEDGKPRQVKYLWRETDLPLTIVVLVDITYPHITMSRLGPHPNQYTEDILQVLRQVFSANDRMAIVGVSDQARLVTDLTGSLEELRSGAAAVRRRVGTADPRRSLHRRKARPVARLWRSLRLLSAMGCGLLLGRGEAASPNRAEGAVAPHGRLGHR